MVCSGKKLDRPITGPAYLIDALQICYSVETALAYSVGNAAHGLANNGMTPEQRANLSPDDPEWALR